MKNFFFKWHSPNDYISEDCWAARLMIEKSLAIKCPSIPYHLAGAKKIQQALALPGILERFFTGDEDGATKVSLLRSVFAGLYSLDPESSGNNALENIKEKVSENPEGFVMKPQREGGGNNIYGTAVVDALRQMTGSELAAHILMERINPPVEECKLVRNGEVYTV